MDKRTGKTFLVKDIAKKFSKYSDAPINDQCLLIRAVLNSIKEKILEMEEDDRILLTGFATFHARPLPQANGRLRHFRTNEIMTRKQKGLKLKTTPCKEIKDAMKSKHHE